MTDTPAPDDTVSFGFEDVSRDEKVSRVKGVFRSVASKYDVMNDLMSAGVHRLWKSDTLARLNPQPGERLIDVAGGTGDIAKAFIERADKAGKRRGLSPSATAIVCDINDAMLMAGKTRKDMAAFADRMDWVCGDAEALPFPDKCADAVTISFGIRNVANRDNALAEFRRVLKPGGRLAVLEFSHMTAPMLQKGYDAYSFAVIPRLGEMVAGDRESYQYLIESIRRFPKQDAFAQEVRQAGFSNVSITNFSGGIAALHTGWAV
jgi:demethylmenaquinone methyltransferase/2-methoxy-6-polyprenyl-1,4-benzoquinol methylase